MDTDAGPGAPPEPLAALVTALLGGLQGLEAAARRLHPPLLGRMRSHLAPVGSRLDAALEGFRAWQAPEGMRPLQAPLVDACEILADALDRFLASVPPEQRTMAVLDALRLHAQAQEALYPLRRAIPPLDAWFAEPGAQARVCGEEPAPPEGVSVGLHRAQGEGERGRGGFSLYVPEHLDGSPAPLVVALHGGSGSGRSFLWTWLREARSRGALLLAPTSIGPTWSFDAPALDGRRLRAMLEFVAEKWAVDRTRVLLTGLSDGATMTLLEGLAEDAPWTHLAPISGVMHPANFANGNLERAAGRSIFLVHGSLDWLFPIGLAHGARAALEKTGAALEWREVEDLSHTYPRELNAEILDWLGAPLPAADA